MSEHTESPARPMNRAAIAAELRSIQSRLAMLSRSFEATAPSEPKRHARPPKARTQAPTPAPAAAPAKWHRRRRAPQLRHQHSRAHRFRLGQRG
jgi:hypothetical protein